MAADVRIVVVLRCGLGRAVGDRQRYRSRVVPLASSVRSADWPSAPVRDPLLPSGLHPHPPASRPAMTTPRTIVEKIWDDHVVGQEPGRAGRPRRRSPPRPRGHVAPGVHRPARPRPRASAIRSGPSRRRTTRPDPPAQPADRRPDGRGPGRPADPELRRVRHPAPRPRLAEPGDRPRHRPAARADPARDDDRLRRLAHRDPRRVRGARVRDRDERGRDGPRDPDAAPAPAEDLRGPGRRPARARRQRQGHHPRPDRPDRRSAAGPATSSSTPARRSAP